jgi:hypothetical protein
MPLVASILLKKFYNIVTGGQCYKTFWGTNDATLSATPVKITIKYTVSGIYYSKKFYKIDTRTPIAFVPLKRIFST